MDVEFFIYAIDQDHALEVAGKGAAKEFESVDHALREYDSDVDEGRKLYRVLVEEIKLENPKA